MSPAAMNVPVRNHWLTTRALSARTIRYGRATTLGDRSVQRRRPPWFSGIGDVAQGEQPQGDGDGAEHQGDEDGVEHEIGVAQRVRRPAGGEDRDGQGQRRAPQPLGELGQAPAAAVPGGRTRRRIGGGGRGRGGVGRGGMGGAA
ncbi:hypothetical protein Asp14428_10660 [Actinoplanes sp. NBRC 14428]|nr:hypothetical protein Asp14428_10660 [Actinoplanes sp. NBRC 14428]